MDSGTLIAGRYRLERVIASGGMGSVWRAQDERLEREVAVKVLHAGLDGSQHPRDRFEREAKTLASLKGPGWVEVYDFGEEPDGDREVPYLVMELVEGDSLAELLHREERLDPARTMRIIAEAAETLATAHRRGIVHRDVKPGNILIDADDRVRVVDFGISLFAHRSRLTPTDAVLGTAPYVSPEQLRDKGVTGSSDLYSLGAVAYECLAGAPPFDAEDPAAIIHGHLYSEPPALPGNVPPAIAGVVARTLQKTPEERWPSGEVLAAACRAATTGEHPVAASSPVRGEVGGLFVTAGGSGTGDVPAAPVQAAPVQAAPVESGAEAATVELGPEAGGRPAFVPFTPPAEPPVTPPAVASAPREEDRRKRRRLVLVGVAVAALVAAIGIVVWSPWSGDSPLQAGEGEATTSGEASDDASSGEPSASGSPSAEATSEEASPQGEATTEEGGGTDEGGGETGGGSDEDDETETAPKEGSGEVPPVTGMTTFEARDYLSGQGFTGAVAELGYWFMTPEPAHCTVMQQSPPAGETADYDATISLSYHSRNAEGTTCEW
ncbi:serine/threonine-protein kinase [Glycomyces harbinensis]|uniref:non-specific serine/threonine protein kinase n=1 Tax=Glycomyces harbinensis TaxID=58114 RepID=A0A1G6SCA6_9ACTN|nr:serine/threonine-protein kinase [Glycomyces harbinensis]SDD14363.1 serine/threonine protein kinase [Glycomyces harbinensis]